jgi:hypothetical protein
LFLWFTLAPADRRYFTHSSLPSALAHTNGVDPYATSKQPNNTVGAKQLFKSTDLVDFVFQWCSSGYKFCGHFKTTAAHRSDKTLAELLGACVAADQRTNAFHQASKLNRIDSAPAMPVNRHDDDNVTTKQILSRLITQLY